MNKSFIKKIVTIAEVEEISKDISSLHNEDHEKYNHALGMKHDVDLITKSLSHESLLIWNIHVWAHFNGQKWDGIFIGMIRKSEKFNKKGMDEYLWFSKNSNSGIKLYKTALSFAKDNGCHYLNCCLLASNPMADKLRKFYKSQGFEKDTETFMKKL